MLFHLAGGLDLDEGASGAAELWLRCGVVGNGEGLGVGVAALEHVGGGDTGADEGFFAVGGAGTAHVAFHPGEAGAAGARTEVRAAAAGGEMFTTDTADLVELGRIFPDVGEILFADVPAGERKLDAGVDVAPRGDVGGGVACATRVAFERVFVDRGWRGAKFFDVSYQSRVGEDGAQTVGRDAQGEQ